MNDKIIESSRTYLMKGEAELHALDVYHLILAPTYACNLRCQHCYLPDHSDQMLSFQHVKAMISQWEQIVVRDRGPLGGYFHLKGGEPLIIPYFAQILDLLTRMGTLRFMMTTNGTILRERDLEAMCSLNEALDGEVTVIVSLDGSCEEINHILRGSNQFTNTLQFAKAIADNGLNLHFNYVVHSGNIGDIPEFVKLAEETGAAQINFLPLVPKGYGLKLGNMGRPDLEELHRLLLQLYREGNQQRKGLLTGNYAHIVNLEQQGICSSCECVAGYKGLFYITPNGDVFSCPNLVNPELRLGNFLNTPLAEIHDVEVEKLYRTRISTDDVDDRYLCRGERLVTSVVASGVSMATDARQSLTQPACAIGDYPEPIKHLQDVLLQEGLTTHKSGRGMSYCFSRNF